MKKKLKLILKTFTTSNFNDLIRTCKQIISLSEENCDGSLMTIQMMYLGENIKDFVNNPIVKNSGILPKEKD